MILRWFISKAVRDACAYRKHVWRLLSAQRDILSPQAVSAVRVKIDELNTAIAEDANTGKIRIKAEELQFAAEKWIKTYPHATYRENVEVLLVALAVAMGVRTFFLQPFKIPTGSMQPTLFGVTSQNLLGDKNFEMPAGWERVKQWFAGVSYVHVAAPADGTIDSIGSMTRFLIFNIKQTISIGGVEQTMWFPPDYGEAPSGMDPLQYRARLTMGEGGHFYHKGDDVVNLRMRAGDHLFVDRFTYNFRKPQRGEIIVFETKGIPEERRENPPYWSIPPDQFYIKRLVGLGGEKIQIGGDRHLVIDGQRLDASTPHFENIYSFDPKLPPAESTYSGHVSQPQMPFFPDTSATYQIPAGHIMVMGDNTMNSLDSRYWGDFPETSVIGKSFFVYWPITSRFGWGNQ